MGDSSSSSENIRVCIRFRPVNQREQRRSPDGNSKQEDSDWDKLPWRWDKQTVVALFPITRSERSRQRAIERYGEGTAAGAASQEPTEFYFDRVYGIDETTETLYDEVMQDLVVSSMEGKHCVAFAFGQTSTGKTYTMQGTSEGPGVIPRAVHDVFSYINQTSDREFLLRVSYLEVYNESINDLFEPSSTNLKVFEDPKQGPRIQGLEEKIVVTPEQVFALISAGEAQRHVGCTDYNKQSSRSHTIFRIVIESKLKEENEKRRPARVATLNLVDLAGSECAHNVQSRTRRQEGSNINRSLLTLTHIIYKLSERAQSQKKEMMHIPYRDSKLTRILQKALQGNSRISIVCTATPWAGAQEETLNTLRFASRAKKVKRAVHVNEILDERALLLKYKQEIALLKEKLADAERKSKEMLESAVKPSQPPVPNAKDDKLREQIDDAIRNLNRVILNSGLQLSQQGKGEKDVAPEEPSDDDQEVAHVTENETPSTPTLRPKTDKSTPFFRKLSSIDHQLELHQRPLSPQGRLQRSRSHLGVESPPRGGGGESDFFPKPGRHARTKSTSDILDTLPTPAQTVDSFVAATRTTKSKPGSGGESITNELKSIREQLSSLLSKASEADAVKAPTPPPTSPSSPVDDTVEYIKLLESRVEELEKQVKKHDLAQSVSKADRSFLEQLLAEKDKTINEWTVVINEIEEKQKALEDENSHLRLQLKMLQS